MNKIFHFSLPFLYCSRYFNNWTIKYLYVWSVKCCTMYLGTFRVNGVAKVCKNKDRFYHVVHVEPFVSDILLGMPLHHIILLSCDVLQDNL